MLNRRSPHRRLARRRWRAAPGDGGHPFPYATYQGLTRSAELAAGLGIGIHIHLSETRQEVEESLAQHGLTPVQVADRSGVFQVPTLAAHCVHVTDDDIQLLKERKVAVAHNPTSNMKLGSGRAPVQKMLDAGLLVAVHRRT